MTQILTLLTESAIVQVSDRRVTHPSGRFTDIDNKVVVYLSLAAYGYTGDAEVGGRTDRWMTEVLAPTAGLGDGANALKDAATAAFRTRPSTLAIVGAGWDPKPDGTFRPFYIVISNYVANELPRSGGPAKLREAHAVMKPGPRRGAFDWYGVEMQPWMSCLLYVAGQYLRERRLPTLLRNIRRALDGHARPLALIRILAEEIWHTAAHNDAVGKSLMAVAVPRAAARTSGPVELASGPPSESTITALYLAGPSADPTYYMPNLAGAGACFTDATVEPAPMV